MKEKNIEFLWLVQMIMTKSMDEIDGWAGIAGDAVAASHCIPSEMTVREAALTFCSVFVKGFAGDELAPVPNWMAALSDPAGTAYRD